MDNNAMHEVQKVLHLEDGVRKGDDDAYRNLFQEVFCVNGYKDSLDILKAVAAQDSKNGKECLLEKDSDPFIIEDSVKLKDSVEQKMNLKLIREADPQFEQSVSSLLNAVQRGPLDSHQKENLQNLVVEGSGIVNTGTDGLQSGGSDVVDYINQRLKQEGSQYQFGTGQQPDPMDQQRTIRTMTLLQGATPLQEFSFPDFQPKLTRQPR
jgi:hypothetical protein